VQDRSGMGRDQFGGAEEIKMGLNKAPFPFYV